MAIKTNKELIQEGITNITNMLDNTDILELELNSKMQATRLQNIWHGILEGLTEKNIYFKHLKNGNMLIVKNIGLLDYKN